MGTTRRRRATLAAACGWAVLTPGLASAQAGLDTDLVGDLLACNAIEESSARLDCYDGIAERFTAAPEADESTLVFAGDGNWASETFEMEETWQLTWQLQGALLTVELRAVNGELIGVVGYGSGNSGGVSDPIDPGPYTLRIWATGSWNLVLSPV